MKFDNVDVYLGQKLFEARVVKRITQEDMAKSISARYKKLKGKTVSRQAYAFYEAGKRSMPIDVFRIACDILGLNWRELFNDALDNCKEEL